MIWLLFLLATVPADVKLHIGKQKAPLILNAGTRKGVQIVAENTDYEVKHFILQ